MKKIISLILILGILLQGVLGISNVSADTGSGSTGTGTTSSGATIQEPILQNSDYQIQSTDGLVASYDFNGDTQDSSGNGNHGTASNLTYETLSNGNKVAVFNGNNSNIGINNYISGEGTISYWIKANSHKNILGSSNHNGYLLYHSNNNGKLKLSTWMGGSNTTSLSTGIDYNDEYIHVIAKWISGYKYDIFINGNYEGYINDSSGSKSRNFSYIGRTSDGHYFNGNISKLSIYSKSLSQSEINTLYQEGQEHLGLIKSNGLVASYDLNGDAQDSSGNENHGTASNVTYETLSNGNKVASFDGVTDRYISTPYNEISNEGTYSKFIKINTFDPNASLLWFKGNSSHPDGKIIRMYADINGKITLGYRYETGSKGDNYWAISTDNNILTPYLGEYIHLVLTSGKNELGGYKLYINGDQVLFTNTDYGVPTYSWIGDIGSGNILEGVSSYDNTIRTVLTGNIGLVKLYNTILSESEINILYQEGQEFLGLVESDGLIASYDLNGDTKDSSGNANHGTASNVTYETLSNGNKVASFDGSSSYITFNDLGNLKAITQCASVKYTEQLGNGIINLGRYYNLDQYNTIRLTARNSLKFSFSSGNSLLHNATDGTNYNDGKWHLICGSWNSQTDGKSRLYIDGTLINISEGSKMSHFTSPISYGHIGGYAVDSDTINPTWKFKGKISQAKIYNKALSQEEINTLYQESKKYLGLNTPVVEVPDAPSNFIADNITTEGVTYTWSDNSISTKQEDKFVIRDENDVIIIDNIISDSTNIGESGLQASTEYQRKICAVNSGGEVCSELVTFTTQIEVVEGKTTPFDFMGIVINVIETAQMFKVEFVIGGFKINFSIEKIL